MDLWKVVGVWAGEKLVLENAHSNLKKVEKFRKPPVLKCQVKINLDLFSRHWDTFYQRGDLEILYESGISHLRVPVGYWLVDVAEGEPFPPPPATDNDGQR
jgi:hypothetical protein